jgi:hypothetical protein
MSAQLRFTGAVMPDEVQLEVLAPWYAQDTSESRTIDFFDVIPKYPFPITTTIAKAERIQAPFSLHRKKYLAEILPAQIKDETGQERLVFPGAREELVERALRFVAFRQIARTD